jgi:hypothetical protein
MNGPSIGIAWYYQAIPKAFRTMSKIAPLTNTSDQSSLAMQEVVEVLLLFGRFDDYTHEFLLKAMRHFGPASPQNQRFNSFYLLLFKLYNHQKEWDIVFINDHILEPFCSLQDLFSNDGDMTVELFWKPIRTLVVWQVRGDHVLQFCFDTSVYSPLFQNFLNISICSRVSRHIAHFWKNFLRISTRSRTAPM